MHAKEILSKCQEYRDPTGNALDIKQFVNAIYKEDISLDFYLLDQGIGHCVLHNINDYEDGDDGEIIMEFALHNCYIAVPISYTSEDGLLYNDWSFCRPVVKTFRAEVEWVSTDEALYAIQTFKAATQSKYSDGFAQLEYLTNRIENIEKVINSISTHYFNHLETHHEQEAKTSRKTEVSEGESCTKSSE